MLLSSFMLRFGFIILLLSGYYSNAQTLVKGKVMENKTRIALAGVRVENLSTKQSVLTDNKGLFSIKAEKNQLLTFKVFSYEPDTVLITGNFTLEVYLNLQTHNLKNVNVTTIQGPGSFAVYDPLFHGQTVTYQTDAGGRPKGGVVFRFWYWKKDERRKKRNERREKEGRLNAQIDTVFTAAHLSKYLTLNNAEMNRFIQLYKPSTAVYFDNDFNLLDYLQQCTKKFSELPLEERNRLDTLKLQ
jgi:hypothetical protein